MEINRSGEDDLRAIGDRMQSEASRLAEWVRKQAPFGTAPYEVCMALLELESCIAGWTEARRQGAAR